MAPLRLETTVRAAILAPGGLALIALSVALGGPDLRWSDLSLVVLLLVGALWIRWERRRKIRAAHRAVITGPPDDRSTVLRRELLFGVPTVGLTAMCSSIEPFVCFGFGLFFLTMVAVELSELSWIERFEHANAVAVVRVVGFHWRSPRFALAPRLKDTVRA